MGCNMVFNTTSSTIPSVQAMPLAPHAARALCPSAACYCSAPTPDCSDGPVQGPTQPVPAPQSRTRGARARSPPGWPQPALPRPGHRCSPHAPPLQPQPVGAAGARVADGGRDWAHAPRARRDRACRCLQQRQQLQVWGWRPRSRPPRAHRPQLRRCRSHQHWSGVHPKRPRWSRAAVVTAAGRPQCRYACSPLPLRPRATPPRCPSCAAASGARCRPGHTW